MDETVSVRYIVDNVDEAIDFYTKILNFTLVMHPAAEFSILSRGNLRLLLSKPSGLGGGGQAMQDGEVQKPGGWNRISLQVERLEEMIVKIKGLGGRFRNEIVTGVGGKQILLEDPSHNLIELFEPFGKEKE